MTNTVIGSAAMKVRLAYGETGMEIDVPSERTVVVTPTQTQAVPDERAALLAALRRPTVGRSAP